MITIRFGHSDIAQSLKRLEIGSQHAELLAKSIMRLKQVVVAL